MKSFYVIVNADKENSEKVSHIIEGYLKANGAACKLSGIEGNGHTSVDDVPEGTECIITLGGDGTLIRAARELATRDIPIIGINLGTLGYLTEVGREDNIKELLDALLENRYQIQERMMLEGRVCRNGVLSEKRIALNDIAVREGTLHVTKFKIYINDELLNEYNADGMLVATPTGSTAYNLSAGGPIAQPDGKLFIMTPICPHTLTSRTIVLGPECKIKIEISKTSRGDARAAFDGDARERLQIGDYIEIQKSDTVTRVIRLNHRSFLDILKHKMAEV